MSTEPVAAVVLAAGLGTRLRPLTDIRPKPLCPVDNVALLDWALASAEAVTTAVAVNVHPHRDQMEAHLAGRPVRISIEEEAPLGTAGALGLLRDWIAGRPVLVVNADTWHRADLRALVEGWDGERCRLLAVRGPRRDFGEHTYAGAALLPWRDVAALEPVPSGLYELVWRRAEDEGRIELVHHDGEWYDCGTPPSYLKANLSASGGRSVVGHGAVVRGEVVRSVVWPRAIVHPGERLVECVRAPGGLTVEAPLRGAA